MYKSILKRTVSIITIIAVFATMFSLGIAASAETSAGSASITYSFSGTNASDAGYAEGVITLSSSSSGTYELYWADDEKALDDYYSLAALEFNSSGSKSVKMAYHTAKPANATKLIATKSSGGLMIRQKSTGEKCFLSYTLQILLCDVPSFSLLMKTTKP